jgi:hypothetical protein
MSAKRDRDISDKESDYSGDSEVKDRGGQRNQGK